MVATDTLPVDGTSIAYEVAGQGVPVVFVHGLVLDRRNWRAQREDVASAHAFVSLDLRGHGDSPLGTGPYTVERHAADLAALLHRLDMGPAHLVGHSLGANVAASLMLAEPALVRSAVLAEPSLDGALPREPASREVVNDLVACMQRVVDALRTDGDEAAMRVLCEWTDNGWTGDWDRVDPDYLEMLQHNAGTIALMLAGRPARITAEQLSSIAIPTLVLNGESSRPFFQRVGHHVAAAIPGATHHVIPGASHDVPRQVPRLFNEVARRFLDAH